MEPDVTAALRSMLDIVDRPTAEDPEGLDWIGRCPIVYVHADGTCEQLDPRPEP